MDRATHCPNCFQEPAPAPRCAHCGFDAESYQRETNPNKALPLFAPLAGGKYRIGRVLGEGGFGVVYAGFVTGLKRKVAIKEFFPPSAWRQDSKVTVRSQDQTGFKAGRERFLLEAEILAKFRHPRLVQIDDSIQENNTAYLIMERLDGHTLSDHLGGLQPHGKDGELLKVARTLPPDDVSSLLRAALEGLAVLHGHAPPVIHRDLTPNNLFLEGARVERLKILDFGLARFGTTTASIVGGTLAFAAPEQLGYYDQHITPATDFYTLGASLYTALTGISPPGAIQRHAEQPPKPLPLPSTVDATLAQVIRACLEIVPEQRPQSVADIRKRLAAGTVVFPDDPEPPPPPPPPPPKPTPQSKPAPTPTSPDKPVPPLKKGGEGGFRTDDGTQNPPSPPFFKGGSAWLLVLLLGAALGAGAYAVWKDGQRPPPAPRPEPAPSPVVTPPPTEPRAYLTVRATPATAQVRIMNIGPAYRDGIELAPGDFDIQVSAPGYQTDRRWYTVAAGTREVTVALQPTASPRQAYEPEMVKIAAGCFQMGSPESETGRDSDERQHRVCVEAFEIGKYEVTQGQWKAVMGDNPSGFKSGDNYPVEIVSWNDPQTYLKKLNQQTGKQYRLPTEAEWEYAARAGTTTPFWTGHCVHTDQANYDGNYDYGTPDCGAKTGVYRQKTLPVGSFKPNPWGLYDTMGNVWEWTCSAYERDYNGAEQRCYNEDTGGPRVLRGGAWFIGPEWLRSAARGGYFPRYGSVHAGFRLARTL